MKHIYISGGLGNQMFQYALYLAFKHRNIPVVLNLSDYIETSNHNGYELDRVFGIKEPTYMFPIRVKSIYTICKRFISKSSIYPEEIFHFDPAVFTSNCSRYMGNWLSADYFNDIEEVIRNVYRFRNINEKNLAYSNKLKCENSVSLHIRRGDYLKHARYNVCDEQYYKEAIQYICEHVESPVFYVFSEDDEWCTEFMKKFDVQYYIVNINRGLDSYQDIYLMSNCKHNIIANSTFSWWGAWLNENCHKIVVAPSTWFTIRQVRIDIKGNHIINVDR